ncbi:MAG: LysM peptidoglycan-binding domain-containing protein [Chloroflexi bacterium]|nr:LysM peptidoglycan-binding domain-containing protein [Chloroflexota bacterium]
MLRRLMLSLAFALLLGLALMPASAQISNPLVTISCANISVSGVAGVSGSLFINVDNGTVFLVSTSITSIVNGQDISVNVPFATQPQGTTLNYSVTFGTFADSQSVACAGPFGAVGLSDGRLNSFDVAAPIAVFCSGTGIEILNIDSRGRTSLGVRASGQQIANGLAQAAAGGVNVQIVASGATSLWALTSNELQAVFRGSSNYDFIFAPLRCNITFSATVITVTATPLAPAGPVFGPVTVPVVNPPVTGGACVAPAGARAAHIVRSGENLFRIGLRYGVDYRIIAAYNGIANPARIFVGQCIIIP